MAASSRHLYGAHRLAEYTAVKEVNTKDNVLRKGDCNLKAANWETHYGSMLKDSSKNCEKFEGKLAAKANREKHGSINLITNDVGRNYALTSRDYGEHRSRRSPAKASIDKDVHIVDFIPKYNTNVPLVRSSVNQNCYKNAYSGNDSKKDRLETEKRTKDVKLTHFALGTCDERLSTETRDCFNDTSCQDSDVSDKVLEKQKNKNLHRSNIFQNGDWNASSRNLSKQTVTSEQFRTKKCSEEDGVWTSRRSFEIRNNEKSSDVPDYKQTHINFGNNQTLVTSFYKKDFMVDKRKSTKIPEIAGPPPSSMVLQRCDNISKPQSINQSVYLPFKDTSCIKDASVGQAKNKMMHSENHIPIAQLSSDQTSKKLMTITKNVFHQPPSDAMTLQHERAPPSKYRYIDTDCALLKPRSSPYKSEVKDRFGIPKTSARSTVFAEDKERQRHDKATHFSFGTDANERTTEQTSQFSQPMKIDSRTIPAGVKDKGTSAFEKVYEKMEKNVSCLHIKNNERSNKERTTSIMHNDYQPLARRSFTSPQQRLVETLAKYPPRIKKSHFFHMDSGEGPLKSRTKMDFIHPDRGQQFTA